MHAIGCADRYVIERQNNVLVVDFRRPDPPAPNFPGAGALRAGAQHGEPGSWALDAVGRPLLAS
jgi:hypothetical protein